VGEWQAESAAKVKEEELFWSEAQIKTCFSQNVKSALTVFNQFWKVG
jgi:hypothetical protein